MGFPVFNLYGTLLLCLTLQGLVFAGLLLRRYYVRRNASDLLLAFVLLITCYHQTAYTLGFMNWYDTYRNTKINYYLVDLSLILAPTILFYIRSTTGTAFKLIKSNFLHLIPFGVYFTIKLVILIYDARQPGFSEVQNGELVVGFEWKYLNPIIFIISALQMLLYLAFSFQTLLIFREKIQNYFANTYRLELRWLTHFLVAYSFLYLFKVFQSVVNEMIVDLSWKQEWWYFLLSGITIIYMGMKGYFTQLTELQNADFISFEMPSKTSKVSSSRRSTARTLEKRKQAIQSYIDSTKPFLNPELSLVSLADQVNMSREDLSDVINQGFNTRFNDYINRFRIDETKRLMHEGKHKQLSLLGIAHESGFNSKATFNRAFRKSENQAPSDYIESIASQHNP